MFLLGVLVDRGSLTRFQDAGDGALWVITPYAVVTLLALGAYSMLGWRQKYLASAVILGPFTLLRPLIIVAAAVVAIVRVDDVSVTTAALLAAVGVLVVEPVAALRWYAPKDARR